MKKIFLVIFTSVSVWTFLKITTVVIGAQCTSDSDCGQNILYCDESCGGSFCKYCYADNVCVDGTCEVGSCDRSSCQDGCPCTGGQQGPDCTTQTRIYNGRITLDQNRNNSPDETATYGRYYNFIQNSSHQCTEGGPYTNVDIFTIGIPINTDGPTCRSEGAVLNEYRNADIGMIGWSKPDGAAACDAYDSGAWRNGVGQGNYTGGLNPRYGPFWYTQTKRDKSGRSVGCIKPNGWLCSQPYYAVDQWDRWLAEGISFWAKPDVTCRISQTTPGTVNAEVPENFTADCAGSGRGQTRIFYKSTAAAANALWTQSNGQITGSGLITDNITFPSAEDYYVTVISISGPSEARCSGNPWCPEWDPVTATSVTDCRAWVDCNQGSETVNGIVGNDVITVSAQPPPAGCEVTAVTDTNNLQIGEVRDVYATVKPTGGATIDQVLFQSQNNSIARMNGDAAVSPSYIYTDNTDFSDILGRTITATGVEGVGVGNTTILVTAYLTPSFGNISCSSTGVADPDGTVTVILPGPWWQTVGGNVFANGSISSMIPFACTPPGCDPYLVRELNDNSSLYPGITLYNSATAPNFGMGNGRLVRDNLEENWLVNSSTPYSSATRHDYSYFFNKIPVGVTPQNPTTPVNGNLSCVSCSFDGYEWYTYTGDFTIESLTLAVNQNAVLFVNGNLTINGNIDMPTPASQFFMAVVNGTINIQNPSLNPPTQTVNGIFVGNQFVVSAGPSQLVANGSVISWGQVNLARDLVARNTTEPAELFNFKPGYVIRMPKALLKRGGLWRELAP